MWGCTIAPTRISGPLHLTRPAGSCESRSVTPVESVPHGCGTVAVLQGVLLSRVLLLFFINSDIFLLFAGLPAGSGVLASQGDQPKKGEKKFFFRALLCVVCSINADSTLRYAPLRTTDAPTDYFSEERSGGLFAKN